MPPPPLPPSKPGSNAGTLIAVMLVLACAMGFFALVMVVNPFIVGILVLPLLLVPLGAFQYMVWGRWLARLQEEDRARESEQDTSGRPR